MANIFFTGFPGFLGSRLLPLVLKRDPLANAVCLTQGKFAALAQARSDEMVRTDPTLDGRIRLVSGDLTAPDLGLSDGDLDPSSVSEIYHLAAIYDLAVARPLGMSVNVEGTRNVLRFAEDCPSLQRHHYISTCYVSGRYCGPYRETDLDVGQRFSNYYEETKFLAEVAVDASREAGVPTTIYRPAIVVGDSVTGATQKFDGPYYLLKFLLRQGHRAVVPAVGDPDAARFNVVPSDFVVDAIAALSARPDTAGATYQLADPHPLTIREILEVFCDATGRKGVLVPLPRRLTTWALDHIGPVQKQVGIPGAAVSYFSHPTHYLTDRATHDLAVDGISCPSIRDYAKVLVAYLEDHPDDAIGVMV